MNALLAIEAELRQLGYASGAIIRDYTFADVLSVSRRLRRVELAAFTQVPKSYQSAAFGVVAEENNRNSSLSVERWAPRSCSRSASTMSGSGGSRLRDAPVA